MDDRRDSMKLQSNDGLTDSGVIEPGRLTPGQGTMGQLLHFVLETQSTVDILPQDNLTRYPDTRIPTMLGNGSRKSKKIYDGT